MKKLILLLLFIPLVSFGQTSYENGFKAGFKKGYCQNEIGCISPIAPIPPIPRIGESENSYSEGFVRGVIAGKNKKTKDTKSSSVTFRGADKTLVEGAKAAAPKFTPVDLDFSNTSFKNNKNSKKNKSNQPNQVSNTNSQDKLINKEKEKPSNSNFDIVYYEDGSRWEGPVTYKEEIVNVDGVLKRRIDKNPYGEGVFIYPDGKVYKGYFNSSLLERESTLTVDEAFKLGAKYFNDGNLSKAYEYFEKAVYLADEDIPIASVFYRAYIDFVHNKDYVGAYRGFNFLSNFADFKWNVEKGVYYFKYKLLGKETVFENEENISKTEAIKKSLEIMEKQISGPENNFTGITYFDIWQYEKMLGEVSESRTCNLLFKAVEYGETSLIINLDSEKITIKQYLEKYCK